MSNKKTFKITHNNMQRIISLLDAVKDEKLIRSLDSQLKEQLRMRGGAIRKVQTYRVGGHLSTDIVIINKSDKNTKITKSKITGNVLEIKITDQH